VGATRIKISPSIISANMLKLSEEVRKIEQAGADMIHVDVYPLMVFAFEYSSLSSITIGTLLFDFLRKRTSLPLEAHLAIEVDDEVINEYIDLGADIITIHPEVIGEPSDVLKIIDIIKSRGIKLGLALTVSSRTIYIREYEKYADLILLVTSNPNFSGKIKLDIAEKKLREIRNYINKCIDLGVDGGMDDETGPRFVKQGATLLVVGKYLFKSKNYEDTINKLRKACMIN
jgi:ribulose-phosphate 3-epimerase